MHVHSVPGRHLRRAAGTVLAGHFSALGHDPRFPEINKNRRWSVGRNCRGGTPNLMRMATYASRPAWELRARAVSSARIAAPLGIGVLLAVSVLLRTRQLDVGLLDRRGPLGRDRRPAARRHPRRAAPGRLAAALLPAAARLAGASRAARRRACTGSRCCSPCSACRSRSGPAGRCSAAAPRGSRRCSRRSTRSSRSTRRRGGCTRCVTLLGLISLTCWLHAFTTDARRASGARPRSASPSRSRRCSTRTTGRCSSARRPGWPGSCCCGARGRRERRAAAAHRAARLRRRGAALRAVDPEHALPGRPHRRAVVEGAVARGARVRAGADPRRGRRDRGAPGRRRGRRRRCCARAAPRGRAVVRAAA